MFMIGLSLCMSGNRDSSPCVSALVFVSVLVCYWLELCYWVSSTFNIKKDFQSSPIWSGPAQPTCESWQEAAHTARFCGGLGNELVSMKQDPVEPHLSNWASDVLDMGLGGGGGVRHDHAYLSGNISPCNFSHLLYPWQMRAVVNDFFWSGVLHKPKPVTHTHTHTQRDGRSPHILHSSTSTDTHV